MADVSDKPQESSPAAGSDRAAAQTAASPDREFMTVREAQDKQASDRDLDKQKQDTEKKVKDGATEACNKDVGDGKSIANNPAVRAQLEQGKTTDANLKVQGDKMSFPAMKDESVKDVLGDGAMVGAATLRRGDQTRQPEKFEARGGSDQTGKPGDNNVRDVNTAVDNPQAVQQRYNSMIDGLGLSPQESDRMKAQFNKDMGEVQKKFSGDDLNHVMRSMNLMMDSNNHLGSDANRVNAVSGLAARGANPEEANRQGANPTCALTSESRIEQERNFAKYADQMGSVAARGGAWRGGDNNTQPTWVNVDAAGTNHANFKADGEAAQMYNPALHQAGGQRDYLGQLDNAVVGGEMAHYASQKDGKDYVYVAANANRVEGAAGFGQNAGKGGLFSRDGSGHLTQTMDGREASSAPPSTLDMVAKVNNANGGGGLYIQENLAAQFKQADGHYPPGMNVFKDAADLRHQLSSKQPPGQEFQIATNGTMVAGMQGHGLHAQEVKLENGQLVFGNNWTDAHNHKTYDDSFINKFTNPNAWSEYHPSHVNPDGSPDWRRENVGPKTDTDMSTRTDKKDSKDEDKKKDEDKDKDKQEKQRKDEARAAFQQQHNAWAQRKAEFKPPKDDPSAQFNEQEPTLTDY